MGGFTIQNQKAMHFLTLTTVGWVDVFTRKEYRDIILESLRYCQKEKGLIIYAYVIMSNHLHLIGQAGEKYELSNILRDFKKFTANTILKAIQNGDESRKDWMMNVFAYHAKYNTKNRKYQFWKQDNHPVELSSPKWIRQKLGYIHLNPVEAGWVEHPEDYLYSSASNYVRGSGLLEVEILDLGVTIGYIDMG